MLSGCQNRRKPRSVGGLQAVPLYHRWRRGCPGPADRREYRKLPLIGRRSDLRHRWRRPTRRVAAERQSREHGSRIATEQEPERSEEHKSELQSLMRITYAAFCLKK